MALFRNRKDFTISEKGLDVVERVNLGGFEQSILIQAENPENPVLLFVHGGPCMPVPGVVSRGQDYNVSITTKNLVKHFVLVFWDQRGAGKSYSSSIPPGSIRADQFMQDCNELIDYLRERFAKEKIYLAGHSWGAVIGLTMASKYPEKLHAYVGISQIMNWLEVDRLSYRWMKGKVEKEGDKKTLKKMIALGEPPYNDLKKWLDFRSVLLRKNSMIYKDEKVKHPGMMAGFKTFLNSPEYSLKDIYHTFRSSYDLTYTQALIEDLAKIDFHQVNRLEVPVVFFHGDKDFHVDGGPVQQFVDRLEGPCKKEMIWLGKSAHMLHPDDARCIEEYFIKEFAINAEPDENIGQLFFPRK